MIDHSDIAEIEINEGEDSIKINRYSVPAPVLVAASIPVAPPALVPVIVSETEPVVTEQTQNNHSIKSPMMGTFYRAASTNVAPFVEVGQSVAVGDTLCIIEAMKILNQIEAESSGIIKQILVDDGQPIEFEQVLFIIE